MRKSSNKKHKTRERNTTGNKKIKMHHGYCEWQPRPRKKKRK